MRQHHIPLADRLRLFARIRQLTDERRRMDISGLDRRNHASKLALDVEESEASSTDSFSAVSASTASTVSSTSMASTASTASQPVLNPTDSLDDFQGEVEEPESWYRNGQPEVAQGGVSATRRDRGQASLRSVLSFGRLHTPTQATSSQNNDSEEFFAAALTTSDDSSLRTVTPRGPSVGSSESSSPEIKRARVGAASRENSLFSQRNGNGESWARSDTAGSEYSKTGSDRQRKVQFYDPNNIQVERDATYVPSSDASPYKRIIDRSGPRIHRRVVSTDRAASQVLPSAHATSSDAPTTLEFPKLAQRIDSLEQSIARVIRSTADQHTVDIAHALRSSADQQTIDIAHALQSTAEEKTADIARLVGSSANEQTADIANAIRSTAEEHTADIAHLVRSTANELKWDITIAKDMIRRLDCSEQEAFEKQNQILSSIALDDIVRYPNLRSFEDKFLAERSAEDGSPSKQKILVDLSPAEYSPSQEILFRQTPVLANSVGDGLASKQSAEERPIEDRPAEEQIAENPTAERPIAQQSIVEQPIAGRPAAERATENSRAERQSVYEQVTLPASADMRSNSNAVLDVSSEEPFDSSSLSTEGSINDASEDESEVDSIVALDQATKECYVY